MINAHKQMEFNTIGVHSARYAAIAQTEDGDWLIPCGPNIRKWRINETEIIPLEKYSFNDNLVMSLERNSKVIVCTSYNSQAAIIDPKTMEKLQVVKGEGTKTRITSLTDDYYVSCSEICFDGKSQTCINIFKFEESGALEPYHKIRASGFCPLLMEGNKLIYMEIAELLDQTLTGDSFNLGVKSISEGKVYLYKLSLFDLATKTLVSEQPLLNNVSEIINYEVSKDRKYAAITFLDKTMLLVDSSARIFSSLNLATTGFITALQFKGSRLYMCPQDGQLISIDPTVIYEQGIVRGTVSFGSLELPSLVSTIIPNKNSTVRRTSFFLIWMDEEILLTGDEDGLYVTHTKTGAVIRKDSHITLTGCGITVNPSGTMTAVGDFAGNVSMFAVDGNTLKSEFLIQCFIGVGYG